MEGFEFLTILVLFIGLPGLILYNVRKMKEAKYRAEGGVKEEGGTLRRSELEAMIAVAVEDAVGPLEARLAELEAELPLPLLEEGKPMIALGDAEEEVDEPVPVRRRIRT